MANDLETNRASTESKKLRKAVELTISSGYQLSQDAFGFLSMIAATEDPADIIGKAVRKISSLNEKRLFIDRGFLESVLERSAVPTGPLLEEVTQLTQEPRMPETAPRIEEEGAFYPYAKEVESDIKIIEDPGAKLDSDGTVQDFLEYFRDRFRRTEKMLRQRIDVKSASSITDALRAASNTKLKIIGMITEKRESKKRVILSVEDMDAGITALIPQNASEDLWKKANSILPDQTV
ncbi:MAG TPA: hypothetical protein VMT06_02550, partial [Candidatus Eisenbacteria bacterium]|nr:hypothetical protein [Candidatus Eisenbacteria bacterium]